jgi:hypothetical protein
MVQSIWLHFKEEQTLNNLYEIINKEYPLELYNEVNNFGITDKRWSISGGYRLKDDTILHKIMKEIDPDYSKPIKEICDCEFCSKQDWKVFGDRVLFYFGITFDAPYKKTNYLMIGRNIWGDLGYDIFTSRLRVLYCFLRILMNLFRDNGIQCYLDLYDCPDIKNELKTMNKKIKRIDAEELELVDE